MRASRTCYLNEHDCVRFCQWVNGSWGTRRLWQGQSQKHIATPKRFCISHREEETMADSHNNSHGKRKWSAAVNTDSTHPREGCSIRMRKQFHVSSHPKRFRPRD